MRNLMGVISTFILAVSIEALSGQVYAIDVEKGEYGIKTQKTVDTFGPNEETTYHAVTVTTPKGEVSGDKYKTNSYGTTSSGASIYTKNRSVSVTKETPKNLVKKSQKWPGK